MLARYIAESGPSLQLQLCALLSHLCKGGGSALAVGAPADGASADAASADAASASSEEGSAVEPPSGAATTVEAEARRAQFFEIGIPAALIGCLTGSDSTHKLRCAATECLVLLTEGQGAPARTALLAETMPELRTMLSKVRPQTSLFGSSDDWNHEQKAEVLLVDQLLANMDLSKKWLTSDPEGKAWAAQRAEGLNPGSTSTSAASSAAKGGDEAAADAPAEPEDPAVLIASLPRPRDVFMVRHPVAAGVTDALGISGRIKYTCIAASGRYLALGATTGGVYCFSRAERKLLQVIPNAKEGAISSLRFAANDRFVAVGTSKGCVIVIEHNLDNLKIKPKRVRVSTDMHKGSPVAHLVWDDLTGRIFSADAARKVSCIVVEAAKYARVTTLSPPSPRPSPPHPRRVYPLPPPPPPPTTGGTKCPTNVFRVCCTLLYPMYAEVRCDPMTSLG